MNQPRSQFFSNMSVFILSPHVLIIYMYTWSLLLTYLHIPSGFHNHNLVTVTVNCTVGETLILP